MQKRTNLVRITKIIQIKHNTVRGIGSVSFEPRQKSGKLKYSSTVCVYSEDKVEIHTRYRSFSLSGNKKINWKPSSGRSQEKECYKRLIYKQFVQVSGFCGPQFLSYLPKRFTHLCRAFYGDAVLVYRFAPIWPPEINENIWSSLFL